MSPRTCLAAAAVLGFTAVLAGTFGAHTLDRPDDLMRTFEVGARYHAYHALALLGLCGFIERIGRHGTVAVVCFVAGTVIFAGSLYLLAITGQRWLGAVTPIGGVMLLGGWAMLLVAWRVGRTLPAEAE